MPSNELTITVTYTLRFADINEDIEQEEVSEELIEAFMDSYSSTLQDETGSVVFETSDQKFNYETMTAEIKRGS
jgi:hypothetical protein